MKIRLVMMKVVDVEKSNKKELRAKLSGRLKGFAECKFIVFEEEEGKIIGVSGIGGIFNVHGIELLEEARGKGLGKILFSKNIEEAKRRGYSYILASRNPANTPIIKLHDFLGFRCIFRIHYTQDLVREAIILILKPKGKIVQKFLGIFNTKVGMAVLSIGLKITRSLLFTKLLAYDPNRYPNPDIKYIIKNFDKVSEK